MPMEPTLTLSEAMKFPLFHKMTESIQVADLVGFKLSWNQIFAFTFDNRILAYGDNSNSLLCQNGPVDRVVEIVELRGKKVVDIGIGKRHCLALTIEGAVWSWGCNRWGQLGISKNQIKCLKPTMIIPEGIKSIRCGANHSMALSTEGKILAWGINKNGRLGNGEILNKHTPTTATLLESNVIVKISCGSFHSLALSDNSRVFAWGDNSFKQLGFFKRDNKLGVEELEFPKSVLICSLACGSLRSAFLATDGRVFSCGNYKPLEQIDLNVCEINILNNALISDTFCDDTLVTYQFSEGDFQNIHLFWNLKGGQTQEKKEVDASLVDIMLEKLKFQTFPEFIKIVEEVTVEEVESINSCYMCDRIASLFNNPFASDLTFVWPSGERLFAHRNILAISSDHLKRMMQDEWIAPATLIADYSYPTFKVFLQFIYAGKLKSHLTFDLLVDLVILAKNNEQKQLENKCIEMLVEQISVDVSCLLYHVASKQEMKVLASASLTYITQHFKEIILTDGYFLLADEERLEINKLWVESQDLK